MRSPPQSAKSDACYDKQTPVIVVNHGRYASLASMSIGTRINFR
jgi:hypothetical protein